MSELTANPAVYTLTLDVKELRALQAAIEVHQEQPGTWMTQVELLTPILGMIRAELV
jgi:hypothetical protein